MTTYRSSPNYTAMLPAFLTTILFAISAVSANRSARILGGIEANFWRITLAATMLGAWAHLFGQGIQGAAFPVFLLSGIIGFGVGDMALFQALPRLGSRLTIMLVHCLASPFAAVAEWIWLGTELAPAQMAGGAIILIGVGTALAPREHLHIPRRLLFTGTAFGILAAAGQGLGAVLSRKAYQVGDIAGDEIDGLTAAYQRILAGWFFAALFLLASRHLRLFSPQNTKAAAPPAPPKPPNSHSIPWVLLNAVAGPTLGVGCYQWALQNNPTGIVLPIVAITPLAVIPLAVLMENERPSFRSLFGGIVAVAGAVYLALHR